MPDVLKGCWEGSLLQSTTLPSLLSLLSQKVKKETCLFKGTLLKTHLYISNQGRVLKT